MNFPKLKSCQYVFFRLYLQTKSRCDEEYMKIYIFSMYVWCHDLIYLYSMHDNKTK